MASKWIGKVAVVTGASSGIGAAIFKVLAQNEIIVIGLARRSELIEATIKDLNLQNAFALKCDVCNSKSLTAAFEWIAEKFGTVSILVNNAGITTHFKLLDDDVEAMLKFNKVIDTNVRGLLQCTREAYRLMKQSDDHGLIININSILGHRISLPLNIYPASKHAVTALTETLRQELTATENNKVRVTVSRSLSISNKS